MTRAWYIVCLYASFMLVVVATGLLSLFILNMAHYRYSGDWRGTTHPMSIYARVWWIGFASFVAYPVALTAIGGLVFCVIRPERAKERIAERERKEWLREQEIQRLEREVGIR